MNTPAPSRRFGKYTLVSKLGMGGMAEVFKAEYLDDPNIVVAIKRILPQFSQDKKLISMLINEARLTVGLSHPNIVPVLDFGIIDSDYFIAMEYIRGKDLKSIMIRAKTRKIDLPIPMVLFILRQVLAGLDHAHNKRDNFDRPLSIIHRDVSPQNIIVSLWGQVKILDFGIAKAASLADETQAGILKGKFSYMSPEQALGDDVDTRTDIFSAGILLWEMLTLESCFQAETDIRLLEKVRNADIRDPSSVNKKIPSDLSAIVMQSLERKPRKRYQTAAEFAAALEAFQRDRFGNVTEADLAAFVRTIFGITPEEVPAVAASKKITAKDLFAGGIDQAIADTVQASSEASVPVFKRRRHRVRWSLPDWVPRAAISIAVIAGLGWFAWKVPPVQLFHLYDRQVIRLVRWTHQFRSPPTAPQPTLLEINLPQVPEPLYALQFSSSAQRQLEGLPFETFERLRDRALDLAFDPHPSTAKINSERPGSWSILQDGFRILYFVRDQPKGVTIETIQKTH